MFLKQVRHWRQRNWIQLETRKRIDSGVIRFCSKHDFAYVFQAIRLADLKFCFMFQYYSINQILLVVVSILFSISDNSNESQTEYELYQYRNWTELQNPISKSQISTTMEQFC